jgi:hypothetical protein
VAGFSPRPFSAPGHEKSVGISFGLLIAIQRR